MQAISTWRRSTQKTSVSGVNQIKSNPDAERGSSKIFSANAKMGGELAKTKPKTQSIPPPPTKKSLSCYHDPKRNIKKSSKTRKAPFHPHTKTENHFGQIAEKYRCIRCTPNTRHKSGNSENPTAGRDWRKRKNIANKSPSNHAAQSWWEQSGIIGEQNIANKHKSKRGVREKRKSMRYRLAKG